MADWLWLLLPILALPLGYLAGRFTKARSRSGLTFVMLLPILAYAGILVVAGPADAVFLLFILVVPLLIWFIMAIVGFTFGRRGVDDLP